MEYFNQPEKMCKRYAFGLVLALLCGGYGLWLFCVQKGSCDLDTSMVIMLASTPCIMLHLQLYIATVGNPEPFKVNGVYLTGFIVNWTIVAFSLVFCRLIVTSLFANKLSCMDMPTTIVFWTSVLLPLALLLEAVFIYGVAFGRTGWISLKLKLEEQRVDNFRSNLAVLYDRIYDKSYNINRMLSTNQDLMRSLPLDEREKNILRDFFKHTVTYSDRSSKCVICNLPFEEDEVVVQHPQCHHLLHSACELPQVEGCVSCPRDQVPTRYQMIKEMRSEEVPSDILSSVNN